MAVIGRHAAVADIGPFHFGGILAWLMWLFIHLMLLVNFESRLVVFIRWAFSYFTYSRGSRVLLALGTMRLPVTGAESCEPKTIEGGGEKQSDNTGKEN
jgi:hypothetical protein